MASQLTQLDPLLKTLTETQTLINQCEAKFAGSAPQLPGKKLLASGAARGVPFAAFREYKPLTRVSPTTQPPPWFVLSPHGG